MNRTNIVESRFACWVAVGMAIITASCSSAYNEYYEEEKVPETNVINGEDGTTFTDEIIPTLSDPQYEIRTTKGTGPFEPYSQDKEHWLNAPFHTFALLTKNSKNNSVNYSDPRQRLLWDEPYYMEDAQGGGHFHTSFDVKSDIVLRYYDASNSYFRYKFFMVHTDKEEELTLTTPAATRVECHISLDGRQDLMHSFAYHTKEQFDAAVKQLPSDRTTSLFLNGNLPEGSEVENEYIYSRMSGNRGIHPIFNMNHLLTRLRIRVQGVKTENGTSDDYMFNLIDKVTVKAPGGATLVVADDSWERDSYKEEVTAGKLITADGVMKDYDSAVESHPMAQSGTIDGVDFEKLDEEYNKTTVIKDGEEVNIYDGTTPYHHVKSTESEYLSEDIMVPPMESYSISWRGRYLRTHKDADGITHIGWKDGLDHATTTEKDYYLQLPVDAEWTIEMKDDEGAPIKFEPGKTYIVNIFIYGYSEIKMQVVPDVEWEYGGEIERGKDDDFTGEGYE